MTTTTIPCSDQGQAAAAALRAFIREQTPLARRAIAERRASMLAFAQSRPRPDNVTYEEGQIGGRRCLTVRPSGAPTGHVLYLHGGAYVLGSPDTHAGLVALYAKASNLVLHVLDYRLAPEHPYPAAVEDCTRAAAALIARHGDIGLIGDSAGGGLAIATLCSLRDSGEVLPTCAAVISPWVDLTLSGSSVDDYADEDPVLNLADLREDAAAYAGDKPVSDPGVSPTFADFTGLPPILAQVGGKELLLDDSLTLVGRLEAAGVAVRLEIYEGMFHAWQAFQGQLPEAATSIARLGGWMDSHMRATVPTPRHDAAGCSATPSDS